VTAPVSRPDVSDFYRTHGCPSVTAQVGFTFSFDTRGLTPGTHVVKVRVRDDLGGQTDSNTQVVTVANLGPRMNIDEPLSGATLAPTFTVRGWAADLSAAIGTGVDDVHVYAFPLTNGVAGPGIFICDNYFALRPDVGAILGAQFNNSGFSCQASGFSPGAYRIGAYVWSAAQQKFIVTQFVDVTVVLPKSDPRMSLDGPANGASITQPFITGGWAVDLRASSGAGVDAIHVWAFPVVNGVIGAGQFVDAALLGGSRPDVGAVFGSQFNNAGFNFLMTGLAPGQYYVGVYARSTVSGTFNQQQFALVTVVK